MYKRLWIWVCLACSFAAGAQAQVSAGDKAAAEALFDRGLALMREGNFEEACARLEQSQAIEHGIGTMLYLAECYEKSGRTASAWALFREASSEARAGGQLERAEAGRQRAERLEPTLSRLIIEVPASNRVTGLEVTRNGTPVPLGVWGEALPVDPGNQQIEARAPGYVEHVQVIEIEKGPGTWRIEIPLLAPAPAVAGAPEPALGGEALAEAPAPMTSAPPPAPPKRGLSTQRIAGLVVGSAGVALLAVGGGFGIRTIKKKQDADDLCGDGDRCASQAGIDANDDAWRASRVSSVGVAGGAALLAAGLITYFTDSERETKVAFAVDLQSASINLGGVF